MAHWHSYNPWADKLVYVPDLYELAQCVSTDPSDTKYRWLQLGPLIDAYILPQESGDHSIGIRYGRELDQYHSPFVQFPDKLKALLQRHR